MRVRIAVAAAVLAHFAFAWEAALPRVSGVVRRGTAGGVVESGVNPGYAANADRSVLADRLVAGESDPNVILTNGELWVRGERVPTGSVDPAEVRALVDSSFAGGTAAVNRAVAAHRAKDDLRVYRKVKDIWTWKDWPNAWATTNAPSDFLEVANSPGTIPLEYRTGVWMYASQFWPNGNLKYDSSMPPGSASSGADTNINFRFVALAEDGKTELFRFGATASRASATDETIVDWFEDYSTNNAPVRVATTDLVDCRLRNGILLATNGLASVGSLPTKVSDLTNDAEYVTASVTNGLASVGSVYARMPGVKIETNRIAVASGLLDPDGEYSLLPGLNLFDPDSGETTAYSHGKVAFGTNTVSIPRKNGTLAVVGDVPSRVSDLTNDLSFVDKSVTNGLNAAVTNLAAKVDAKLDDDFTTMTNSVAFTNAVAHVSPQVELPTKWALANVTNAQGQVVTAADVKALPFEVASQVFSRSTVPTENWFVQFGDDGVTGFKFESASGLSFTMYDGTRWQTYGIGTYGITGDGRTYAWDEIASTDDVYTKEEADKTFLTEDDVSGTYLSKKDAGDTYLSKKDAGNTYLSKQDAEKSYLRKNEASETYATKEEMNNVRGIADYDYGIYNFANVSGVSGVYSTLVRDDEATNILIYLDGYPCGMSTAYESHDEAVLALKQGKPITLELAVGDWSRAVGRGTVFEFIGTAGHIVSSDELEKGYVPRTFTINGTAMTGNGMTIAFEEQDPTAAEKAKAEIAAAGLNYAVKSNSVGEAQVRSLRFTDESIVKAVVTNTNYQSDSTVFERILGHDIHGNPCSSWFAFGADPYQLRGDETGLLVIGDYAGVNGGDGDVVIGNTAYSSGYGKNVVIGGNAQALSSYSVVIGNNNQSYFADHSVVIGYDALASGEGDYSAEGTDVVAVGDYVQTRGSFTTAVGGGGTTADGQYSTALGWYAHATTQALAVGAQAEATDYATAVGPWSVARANGAVALGPDSYADHEFAVTIGGWYQSTESGPVIYTSHGPNTINFATTDNPDSVYFRDKTLSEIIIGTAQEYLQSEFVPYENAERDLHLGDHRCYSGQFIVTEGAYPTGAFFVDSPYGPIGGYNGDFFVNPEGVEYRLPFNESYGESSKNDIALVSQIEAATNGLVSMASVSGARYIKGDTTAGDCILAYNSLLSALRGDSSQRGFTVSGSAGSFATIREAIQAAAGKAPGVDVTITAQADFRMDGSEDWGSLGSRRAVLCGSTKDVTLFHTGPASLGVFSNAKSIAGVVSNLTVSATPGMHIADTELVNVRWKGWMSGRSPLQNTGSYGSIRMSDVEVSANGGKYALDITQGSAGGDSFERCSFSGFVKSAVGFCYNSGNATFTDCTFDGSSVHRLDTVGLVNFQTGGGNPVFRRCTFKNLARTVGGIAVNGPAVADRVPDGEREGTMTFDGCVFDDTVSYVIAYGDPYGRTNRSTHVHFKLSGDNNWWKDWDSETGTGTKMRQYGARYTGYGYLGDAPAKGGVTETPWEGGLPQGTCGSVGRRYARALMLSSTADIAGHVPVRPGMVAVPKYAPLSEIEMTRQLLLNPDELLMLKQDRREMTNFYTKAQAEGRIWDSISAGNPAFSNAVRTAAAAMIRDAVSGLDPEKGNVTVEALLNALKGIGK